MKWIQKMLSSVMVIFLLIGTLSNSLGFVKAVEEPVVIQGLTLGSNVFQNPKLNEVIPHSVDVYPLESSVLSFEQNRQKIQANWQLKTEEGTWEDVTSNSKFLADKNYRLKVEAKGLVPVMGKVFGTTLPAITLNGEPLTMGASAVSESGYSLQPDGTVQFTVYSKTIKLKEEPTLATSSEEPLVHAMRAPVTNSTIYIDGVNGDDSKDGSLKTNAIKTIARARELALAHPEITTIYVVGTVDASGEISLDGTHAKFIREESFAGYLFSIKSGNQAILKNVVIDGNGSILPGKKSLIEVNGTLTISSGAVLENNVIEHTRNTQTFGGAVFAHRAKIIMDGGIVQNNQAVEGGGIYLKASEMTFTDGVVSHNKADGLYDTGVSQYYGSGGGILLIDGSTLNISGMATVKENSSAEVGGGISVGNTSWSNAADTLNMTGGVVEGNQAGAAGGGIFIQAGLRGRVSKAYISAGKIINNRMNGSGSTNSAFGGGGIYVNGMPESYAGMNWMNGELHLTNVGIYDNEARIAGGGMAVCPISKTYVYVTDGAAIYHNNAAGAKDFYLLSSTYYGVHSGEPDIELSDRMLGGQPYEWKDDEGNSVDTTSYVGTIPNGTEIRLHTDHYYTSDQISNLAKVTISGNTSVTRGGGIGSNGTIYIGRDTEKKDIEVVKKWGSGLAPEEIEVEVRVAFGHTDWLLEKITLNSDNHFTHTIKDLPSMIGGQNIESLVYIKELNADRYRVTISDPTEKLLGKRWSFTLNRPQFSSNEMVNAVYANGHMNTPETGVFDRDEWNLNDFSVNHVLHNFDGSVLAEGRMTYTKDDSNWTEEATFTDVPIDVDEIEIQYYDNEGSYVIPWLLSYDLYLEKQGNKAVLKVPDLWPMNVTNFTGSDSERVIKVTDLKRIDASNNKIFTIIIQNDKPWTPMEPAKTKLPVRKIWQGTEAEQMPAIKVYLVKNGQKTNQYVELNKDNQWTSEFTDLPHSDTISSPANVYSVYEEGEVAGKIEVGSRSYNVTYDKGTIINSLENPKKKISGEKIWQDQQNQDGLRPNEVFIHLYANGQDTGKHAKAQADTNWTYQFDELDTYDRNGRVIEYSVQEEEVTGYTSEINGFTITNTHQVEMIEIPVEKVWQDQQNSYNFRPNTVHIRLYADGEEVEAYDFKENEQWKHIFRNLPKYKDGKIIQYTISEDVVQQYQASIRGDSKTGFTVENRYMPIVYVTLPVYKNIEGNPREKENFTFTLKRLGSSNPMPDGCTSEECQVEVLGTGSVEFGNISFSQVGTYQYEVREINHAVKGYWYDPAVYLVTYEVREENGALVADRTIEKDGEIVPDIRFINRYDEPKKQPKLPIVGTYVWPMSKMLVLSGSLLICAIWIMKRNKVDYSKK